MRLDALPIASAEELLAGLLGTGPGLADLPQLLIDRTQGNPFFLEESVRALVETRALTGQPGAYRLAGPVQSFQLPATAQAILAARIDRLAPGDKRLLQSFALIAPVLGAAYTLAGRPRDGIPLLEKACDAGRSMGAGNLQSRRMCWLGEAYLGAKQIDDATQLAEQALRSARDQREPPNEARAHRLLGEVAVYRDPGHGDAAEGHYHRGVELARRLEMRPLVAHCHSGLGELYHRTNKGEQAQEHLAIATTMYREMGMTYWLEKAETELRELR